ncbi:MAG: hypothetical protein R2828_07665 [Saprospiraceae bacterium]
MSRIKLNRTQFWQLHKQIFEKCFGHDFNIAFQNTPDVTKLYGFGKAKDYENSIKNIIDPNGQKKLNTRLLHDLRKDFDQGETFFEITEYLLSGLLSYLKIKFADLNTNEPPPLVIKHQHNIDFSTKHDSDFDARFADLKNSVWYLYVKDKNAEGKDVVFRSILQIEGADKNINGDLNVYILTPGNAEFSNFKGKLIKNYSNLNVIHIILNADSILPIHTKFRYLVFRIEATGKIDRTKELYFGQYLRYDSNNVISSSTIIAHRQDETNKHQLKPTEYIDGAHEVEKNIAAYFRLAPSTLFSLSNIFSPHDLEREVHKLKLEHHDQQIPKIDLYIAAPITYLLNRKVELEDLYHQIEMLSQNPILNTLGIEQIYYRKKQDLYERTSPNNQLQREMTAIHQAKCFLFIYPLEEVLDTSVDILLGAAIYANKPVYILNKGVKYLPRIVRKETDKIKLIDPEVTIQEFPEWLKDNP